MEKWLMVQESFPDCVVWVEEGDPEVLLGKHEDTTLIPLEKVLAALRSAG